MISDSGTSNPRFRAPDPCSVCRAPGLRHFQRVAERDYWRCATCGATHLDSRHWLGREDERAEYLLHENNPEDAGYRRFLSRLAEPLRERVSDGARCLDYGCGPHRVLAIMLEESGLDMACHDPFFHRDTEALDVRYDAIAVSETAEHFHHPAAEFDRLDRCLEPGGWLGVMTCFQTDDARFADWHYRRDPTHVVFYTAATFRVLAGQRGWQCEFPVKDVALMHKPGPVSGATP